VQILRTAAGQFLDGCDTHAASSKATECSHQCYIDAHKAGKSCEKCNPNKEDLKKEWEKKQSPAVFSSGQRFFLWPLLSSLDAKISVAIGGAQSLC
jgi:hypothetical protein